MDEPKTGKVFGAIPAAFDASFVDSILYAVIGERFRDLLGIVGKNMQIDGRGRGRGTVKHRADEAWRKCGEKPHRRQGRLPQHS